jgi:predicted transcriptional regulator
MARRGKTVGKEERPELSRLETEIMDVIWGLGECSSAQVIAAYSRRRKLAPTTIRTVLSNLRKKQYLEPVPTIERGFRLRATVNRDAVARKSLKSLVTRLFGGSPRQAIAYLLKAEEIDESDLDDIRRLLDEKRGGVAR